MEFLEEIGKQVPALAVLAFIVRIFIRAQGDHAREMRDLVKLSHENFKSLNDECHTIQRDGMMTTKEHTAALGDLKLTLVSLKATLRQVNGGARHG